MTIENWIYVIAALVNLAMAVRVWWKPASVTAQSLMYLTFAIMFVTAAL